MLNLILTAFGEHELARILDSVTHLSDIQILEVGSEHAALEATERGITVAVVARWDSLPTAQQLESIQRLVNLKIPAIPVYSGVAGYEQARLAALHAGAIDCLRWESLDRRLPLLLELFATRGRQREQEVVRSVQAMADDGLVLASPAMTELFHRLARVAPLGSTILLTGETGVGKSTIARWIHQQSARKDQPFVDVPCAALPGNLAESELFGHVRGAFTSADRDHVGKFTVAGKGTLLLDEIDCLPLEVQGKLLRAVERREYERVGSTVTENFRARLIVATNRPLEEEVAAGRFRSDLYYRLGVMAFRVPSLRERTEAIEPLAEALVAQFARQHARRVHGISPAALATLKEYAWPGNIRELRNALDYAVAVAMGQQVQWSDLPEQIRQHSGLSTIAQNPIAQPSIAHPPVAQPAHASPAAQPTAPQPRLNSPSDEPLISHSRTGNSLTGNSLTGNPQAAGQVNQLAEARTEAERAVLLAALRQNNYNRTKTAATLGISRVTLYKRLERFQILAEVPDSRWPVARSG
jgi:DNA-binding NtrC family response regulator